MVVYSCCIVGTPWQVQPWAQFGGGHGGRVPPTFLDGGHNMLFPPHFPQVLFGEISKLNVTFVTFCVKDFSC